MIYSFTKLLHLVIVSNTEVVMKGLLIFSLSDLIFLRTDLLKKLISHLLKVSYFSFKKSNLSSKLINVLLLA